MNKDIQGSTKHTSLRAYGIRVFVESQYKKFMVEQYHFNLTPRDTLRAIYTCVLNKYVSYMTIRGFIKFGRIQFSYP